MKNLRQLRLKSREISAAAGQTSKSVHFIVALQVIHLPNGDAHSVSVTTAMGFAILADGKPDAHRENGYIVRGLYLFYNLVKIELAKGVHASGDHDNVFAALNLVDAIKRVIQRIEEVSFCKTGHAQLIQRTIDRLFILSEIGQDMRLHVIRNHRNPVVFLERVRKCVAGIQRIHHEVVICGSKFHQQHCRNRCLRNIKICH